MCYKYGMEICQDVLTYLSENKFDQALSEIEIMEQEDVSDNHYNEIKELLHKYYYYEDLMTDTSETVEVQNTVTNNRTLPESLKDLCFRIMNFNQDHLHSDPMNKC